MDDFLRALSEIMEEYEDFDNIISFEKKENADDKGFREQQAYGNDFFEPVEFVKQRCYMEDFYEGRIIRPIKNSEFVLVIDYS